MASGSVLCLVLFVLAIWTEISRRSKSSKSLQDKWHIKYALYSSVAGPHSMSSISFSSSELSLPWIWVRRFCSASWCASLWERKKIHLDNNAVYYSNYSLFTPYCNTVYLIPLSFIQQMRAVTRLTFKFCFLMWWWCNTYTRNCGDCLSSDSSALRVLGRKREKVNKGKRTFLHSTSII